MYMCYCISEKWKIANQDPPVIQKLEKPELELQIRIDEQIQSALK